MNRRDAIDIRSPFLAAVPYEGIGIPDVHAIYVVNPLHSALLQLVVGSGGHRSSHRKLSVHVKGGLPQPLHSGEAAIADLSTGEELEEVDLLWAIRYCIGRTSHSAEFIKSCGWDECRYFERLPVLGTSGYVIPRIE